MFKIPKELSQKLSKFIANHKPVLATANVSAAIWCPNTCATNCVGSCTGTCTKNCSNKVK